MELNDENGAANTNETEAKMDSQPQLDVETNRTVGSLAVGTEMLALREFFERNWGDVAFGD